MARVAALEIMTPGPLSTVQDLGRRGYGRYGVPPSGALDPFALRVGNLLVGNEEGEAGIEMTFMGLTAKVLTDLTLAITGADLPLKINGRPLGLWQSHRLQRGDVLSLGTAKTGARAYLAVGGGISVPKVMGSKSTNLSSGFGGFEGRALREGDILYCQSLESDLSLPGRQLDPSMIPVYLKDWTLRILFGPQDEQFTHEAGRVFRQGLFSLRPSPTALALGSRVQV